MRRRIENSGYFIIFLFFTSWVNISRSRHCSWRSAPPGRSRSCGTCPASPAGAGWTRAVRPGSPGSSWSCPQFQTHTLNLTVICLSSPVILNVYLYVMFCLQLVWPKELIRAPDKTPKVFSILYSNSPRYWNFHAFLVLSAYTKFHSM